MGGTLVFCERCLPMMLSLRKGNVDLATAHVGAGALTRPAMRSIARFGEQGSPGRARAPVPTRTLPIREPMEIGIGGAVARSPLPHHQDMRVRIRRFGGLS
ncbi:MAG: hypothetical protein DMG97_27770 [Acidobacteria bacterium]|nr:MAG: hypothetical protein DMG98_10635 [Acidobacteriota bacterium]PYV67263.1 MAG: hypothetical protein DMG97_27770 [Acidobacteriota bacterium]PYV76375.1 MAG: hypothetical protein DMG96_14270 [Acidobacteriota bacterium]